jgi:hypothetical protein
MEPTDLRHGGDDLATGRWFDHSWLGTVVGERLVRSCGVVIGEIGVEAVAAGPPGAGAAAPAPDGGFVRGLRLPGRPA